MYFSTLTYAEKVMIVLSERIEDGFVSDLVYKIFMISESSPHVVLP